jgi:hypothetical protein
MTEQNPYLKFMSKVAGQVLPSDPQIPPSEDELVMIEDFLKGIIKDSSFTTAQQALDYFLDVAYSGQVAQLSPQFPRSVIEFAVQKARADSPEDWEKLAAYFNLKP